MREKKRQSRDDNTAFAFKHERKKEEEEEEKKEEHASGDERTQTQASFAGPIIEQQRIQVQIYNRAIDVDHTQKIEE